MFTDMEQRFGSLRETARRSGRRGRQAGAVRVAGLMAVAVAGLLAAAPAGAQAPPSGTTMFTHSAKSGELGGGRLTLHGVGGQVTWAHHSGRFGVMAVKRLHRILFSPKTPAATGTLHVAGHHGGDELTLKLSRPRYNAARSTVSYKVMRLGKGRLPSRAVQAAGAPRPFGAASLSILGTPRVMGTPSVDVQTNTYPCSSGYGTCWGTISASGLPAGDVLAVSGPQVPGNTGQSVEVDMRVDANGNVPTTPLDLLCFNDYHVTIPNISVDLETAGGQFLTHLQDNQSPGCS
jgi:hypothetical protein